MLESQGAQPPVTVDTSWLVVGHVDEIVHVVRADNRRGWTIMVADPRLAVDRPAVRAHHRQTQADRGQTLGDRKLLRDNEITARGVEAQVAVLLAETGLRPDEVVRVPALFHAVDIGQGPRSIAFSPNSTNGISLTDRDYAAPDPHGPVVAGTDIF
ncbi:protein-arginine deiminase (PAD) [Herbihabitans rhizosphaerae]|uniref:Protein-arginine deiminase (PAD) n=1 Tax=Herbihabitans rhizosphaerae TaxID=1872711 RepID=A0A4V2EU62_9PSEU|nr:protein-arginine deiminase (PAD) [Herbihabitans rhizosphaerae]